MIKTYGLDNKTIEFITPDGAVHKVSIYPSNNMGTFYVVDNDDISAWTFLHYLQMPNYFNENNNRIVGMAPPMTQNLSPVVQQPYFGSNYRKF